MSRVNEISSYLEEKVEDGQILIKIKREGEYDVIDITPEHPSDDVLNASLSIVIDEKRDYVGLHIGRGNFSDTTEPYASQDKEYILEVVLACINGKIEEDLVERDGKVLKSKLSIMLPDGKQILHYRSGLFIFGGKKTHIKYQPYLT